jgi:hypothetical protein
MDRQIIRDLVDALLAASAQLGIEDELTREARRVRPLLPPDRVGHAGQLQEWLEDWDMQAPEMDHRHVSHLYGLYPSRQIDIDRTPLLAGAARRSLEIRGDEATGWGIGWRLNLWARLGDGEHAHKTLQMLVSPARTYPNPTATLAGRQASSRCWCRRERAGSISSPRCRRRGPQDRFPASAPAAISSSTSPGPRAGSRLPG